MTTNQKTPLDNSGRSNIDGDSKVRASLMYLECFGRLFSYDNKTFRVTI